MNFNEFPPRVASRVFVPAKVLGTALTTSDFALDILETIGTAVMAIINLVYLMYLTSPVRRDATGIVAFSISEPCLAQCSRCEHDLAMSTRP